MRRAWFASAIVLSCAFGLASTFAQQPPPKQGELPGGQAQPAPPAPYKALEITLSKLVADATLDAFRKELSDIAKRKDRVALGRLMVYRGFFWDGEDDKSADPRKSAIDNLAVALGLDTADGWEMLAALAAEPNAAPYPDKRRVVCAPAFPSFDEEAFEDLATAMRTESADWGYPTTTGIEVRAAPDSSAPAIEKLGLHLVRMLPPEAQGSSSAANADWIRIVTPSGKTGFVPVTAVLPLPADQICYIKEGGSWRIAGIVGGGDR